MERGLRIFRRQFLVGRSEYAPLPEGWVDHAFMGGWRVCADEDLNVTVSKAGELGLCVIGEIIDPLQPGHGNEDVVAGILASVKAEMDGGELHGLFDQYGGRWVALVLQGEACHAVMDASGSRQAFYREGDGGVELASQVGLFRRFGSVEVREDFLALERSSIYAAEDQYWWAGWNSPYVGVKRLGPNHVLDMSGGEVKRVGPFGEVPHRELDDAVEEVVCVLKGTLDAMSRRHKLVLPLTGGMDSRVALAACRDISDKVSAYTLISDVTPRWHSDVVIARRLARCAGMSYSTVECPWRVNESFSRGYHENCDYAHEQWARWAEGMLGGLADDAVAIRATVSEIGSTYYSDERGHAGMEATAENVAEMAHLGDPEFTLRGFGEWLEDLEGVEGVDMFEMFYWEQRVGSWATMNYTEWDYVQEVFSPFSHRGMMLAMLGVAREYRVMPDYVLHNSLLEAMWPELRKYPINPDQERWGKGVRGAYVKFREMIRSRGFGGVVRRLSEKVGLS